MEDTEGIQKTTNLGVVGGSAILGGLCGKKPAGAAIRSSSRRAYLTTDYASRERDTEV